jgi:hypothetical protein
MTSSAYPYPRGRARVQGKKDPAWTSRQPRAAHPQTSRNLGAAPLPGIRRTAHSLPITHLARRRQETRHTLVGHHNRLDDLTRHAGRAGRRLLGPSAVTAVSSAQVQSWSGAGSAWTSCRACGWDGGPHDYRCVEYWTEPFGGPGYLTTRPTCPACGARVPRR